MGSPKISPRELHENDYYGWIREQVRALRGRDVDDIDFDNVAEEVEDLGKSERRSAQSQMETLSRHLLKLSYASRLSRVRNVRSRENTIELARFRFKKLLDESPSLRPVLEDLFNDAYKGARISARRALGFPAEPLPETPPRTLAQVLDDSFVPKAQIDPVDGNE
jgi:hypothetical protein